jgi:ATP-dependent Lon protease
LLRVLHGEKCRVQTVEEQEFPQFYHLKPATDPNQQEKSDPDSGDVIEIDAAPSHPTSQPAAPQKPEEGHHVFAENRKGVSYDKLFGPYLQGASRIIVTDPYIRFFYQTKNMMEFVEMVIQRKAPEDGSVGGIV